MHNKCHALSLIPLWLSENNQNKKVKLKTFNIIHHPYQTNFICILASILTLHDEINIE